MNQELIAVRDKLIAECDRFNRAIAVLNELIEPGAALASLTARNIAAIDGNGEKPEKPRKYKPRAPKEAAPAADAPPHSGTNRPSRA